MGKTDAFKKLALNYNDFTFCVELSIKANLNPLEYLIFRLMKDQELVEKESK